MAYGFLKRLLHDRRHLPGLVLRALIRIDPALAFEALVSGPTPTAFHCERLSLDRLLDAEPDLFPAWLRKSLMARESTGEALADVWSDAVDRIDADTLTTLLDCLEDQIVSGSNGKAIRALLKVLGHLHLDPKHDGLFATRRNTPLSAALFERAGVQTQRSRNDDEERVHAKRVLRRIGGAEYEELILHLLDRKRFLQIAESWKRTELAREFIERLKRLDLPDSEPVDGRSLADWIGWAEAKAGEFDPLRQGVDRIFGDIVRITAWTRFDD